MNTSFTDKLPSLTIANGATQSNTLPKAIYQDAALISLIAPAAVEVGHTYVIEVLTPNGTYVRLQAGSPLADISPPVPAGAAGRAAVYSEVLAFEGFRLVSATGVQTADRTWQAQKHSVI